MLLIRPYVNEQNAARKWPGKQAGSYCAEEPRWIVCLHECHHMPPGHSSHADHIINAEPTGCTEWSHRGIRGASCNIYNRLKNFSCLVLLCFTAHYFDLSIYIPKREVKCRCIKLRGDTYVTSWCGGMCRSNGKCVFKGGAASYLWDWITVRSFYIYHT